MKIRRARSLLWLASSGLIACCVAGVAAHLMIPVRAANQRSVPVESPGSEEDLITSKQSPALDHAELKQVASRNIRHRLFDPPVIAPKPPPPKPLPPIQLLSTIIPNNGEASAWVQDGAATRKVEVGDTLGPETNPVRIQLIETNRLIVDHEESVVEIDQSSGGR